LGAAVFHAWDFAHPEWTTGMDVDPTQTVATRRRLLDRATRHRSLIHGFHIAQLGHVEGIETCAPARATGWTRALLRFLIGEIRVVPPGIRPTCRVPPLVRIPKSW
jgi:hypothetical protein